jgi:hypothetical protein
MGWLVGWSSDRLMPRDPMDSNETVPYCTSTVRAPMAVKFDALPKTDGEGDGKSGAVYLRRGGSEPPRDPPQQRSSSDPTLCQLQRPATANCRQKLKMSLKEKNKLQRRVRRPRKRLIETSGGLYLIQQSCSPNRGGGRVSHRSHRARESSQQQITKKHIIDVTRSHICLSIYQATSGFPIKFQSINRFFRLGALFSFAFARLLA